MKILVTGGFIDQTNVGAITLATLSVMTNRPLREELITKGLQRARFFLGGECAVRTKNSQGTRNLDPKKSP